MRLRISKAAAEEELITLVNEGYRIYEWVVSDYTKKRNEGSFDSETDNAHYRTAYEEWGNKVIKTLNSIFPTEMESNKFLYDTTYQVKYVDPNKTDTKWLDTKDKLLELTQNLRRIIEVDLVRYTDLPIQTRLYIEDIDSFRKARDVNPAMVSPVLKKDGYLDLPEDTIQIALEQIVDEPFHKKDWGGEKNDLYTANFLVNGTRTATACLLKGNGLKRKTLEIRDCGKNGDQLLRLFESPAQLFIVQFVGIVSESVIKDVENKVNEMRGRGKPAYYCIMNGQDTARVLYAYGKLIC